jgi:hypothetical protein
MNPERHLNNQDQVREIMRKLRQGNSNGQQILAMGPDGQLKAVSQSEASKPGYSPIYQEDLKVSFQTNHSVRNYQSRSKSRNLK